MKNVIFCKKNLIVCPIEVDILIEIGFYMVAILKIQHATIYYFSKWYSSDTKNMRIHQSFDRVSSKC